MTVTIADQLKCARRELALRQRAYPRWIDNGRMSRDEADREIEAMSAIVATLQTLQAVTT
jgi:hypothetical protein